MACGKYFRWAVSVLHWTGSNVCTSTINRLQGTFVLIPQTIRQEQCQVVVFHRVLDRLSLMIEATCQQFSWEHSNGYCAPSFYYKYIIQKQQKQVHVILVFLCAEKRDVRSQTCFLLSVHAWHFLQKVQFRHLKVHLCLRVQPSAK